MDDEAIAAEIAPAFIREGARRTDVVVLGCTHYPLLLGRLETLSPWPVNWLDPSPAIARRIANVLVERGHIAGVGARHGRGSLRFTTGKPPAPALIRLLQSHRLSLSAQRAAFAP